MFGKALAATAMALGVALSLTACDPPMPPEMVAEIAERTFVCGDAPITVAIPGSLDGQAENWIGVLADACPAMPITAVGATEKADIVLAAGAPAAAQCKPFASAPFALDGTALVFMSSEISNLNLDAKAIAAIINGELTSWDDPAITALNPDAVMPSAKIVFDPAATQAQADALTSWLSRLAGSDIKLTGLKIDNAVGGQDRLYNLPEGSFALANFAEAMAASATTVTVVTGKDTAVDVVTADAGTLASAGSQLVAKADGNNLAVSLDPGLKPAPPAGSDTALAPYQAVFPINMYLCGTDNLNTRAMARYLLRQDTQGNIAAGTAVTLPAAVRFKAIEVVAVGLPTPKPTSAE